MSGTLTWKTALKLGSAATVTEWGDGRRTTGACKTKLSPISMCRVYSTQEYTHNNYAILFYTEMYFYQSIKTDRDRKKIDTGKREI